VSAVNRNLRIHKVQTRCEGRAERCPFETKTDGGFVRVLNACMEYFVNLRTLNDYVLAVVAVLAGGLYVAMVAAGFVELRLRLTKGGSRKKPSSNVSAARKWRDRKKSTHS
jgi:hypothetical protein